MWLFVSCKINPKIRNLSYLVYTQTLQFQAQQLNVNTLLLVFLQRVPVASRHVKAQLVLQVPLYVSGHSNF